MKYISKFIIAFLISCLFYAGAKADVGPLLVPLNTINNTNNKPIILGLVIADNILTSGYFIEKDKLIDQYNHGQINYYRFERQKLDLAFVNFFETLISAFTSKAFVTGYKALKIVNLNIQHNQ